MTWIDIRQWIAEEDRLIARGYDSITVFDGEEGSGKSLAMLAKNVLSDPTFFKPGAWSEGWRPSLETDRVVFDMEDFMSQGIKVAAHGPGKALQLDELDGHRRAGNTRNRLRFLRFLKERRALQLRATIGYPHVSQLDRDILLSRVRYRAELKVMPDESRWLKVKQRMKVREYVDRHGSPVPVYDWVHRGTFKVPDISGFKCTVAYGKKKDDFTNRPAELDEPPVLDDLGLRHIDTGAAMPVIDRIRTAVLKPNAGAGKPYNETFLNQVLEELKDPA